MFEKLGISDLKKKRNEIKALSAAYYIYLAYQSKWVCQYFLVANNSEWANYDIVYENELPYLSTSSLTTARLDSRRTHISNSLIICVCRHGNNSLIMPSKHDIGIRRDPLRIETDHWITPDPMGLTQGSGLYFRVWHMYPSLIHDTLY